MLAIRTRNPSYYYKSNPNKQYYLKLVLIWEHKAGHNGQLNIYEYRRQFIRQTHKTSRKSSVCAAPTNRAVCGNKQDELMSAHVVSVILARIAYSCLLGDEMCTVIWTRT